MVVNLKNFGEATEPTVLLGNQVADSDTQAVSDRLTDRVTDSDRLTLGTRACVRA